MKPKNVQNDHPLTIQEQYLRKHKNHHRQVAFLRIFLLGIFLILWEISADAYWIDSFFFSSPRRVVLCLIQLWTERSLPMHIGITLLETILSFLLVFVISLLLATLLWFSDKLSEISGTTQQSTEICPGSPVHRLAGHRHKHHYHRRDLCGSLRLHYQLLHCLSPGGSGKGDSDPHFGWKPQRYLFQSRPPGICSHAAQHHQGQYRSVFSRCHHRRISGSQTRAGLSHHLRFPGVPAGYGDQFYLTVMCHCHAALSADPVSGTLQQKASQLIIMFSSEICRMASSSYSLLHNLQFCETNF